VALREMNRVVKRGGALLVRDVRRLPEPLMSMALPFWCLGYSRRLREQTVASFRAALTREEFRRLAADAGLTRFSVKTHLLTHQTVCRAAEPRADASHRRVPTYRFPTRLLKSAFVSAPR
jgi:ubiquinone/menaquinone biosynthesis C-methylase UbiE